MSEPLDDPTLDRLIDDAARSLTAERVPGDLRARVFERLHEDADRGWKRRWLVPGMAIVSACIAAVAIYVGSGFSRSNDVADVNGSRTPEIRLPSTSLGPGKPDPTNEVSSRRTPDPTDEAAIRPKPDPTTTSSVVQSEPPPGFEPIAAPGLIIDALGVAALMPLDAMSVESIPVESIEVSALGTE